MPRVGLWVSSGWRFPARASVIDREMQRGLSGARSSLNAFVLKLLLDGKACGLVTSQGLDQAIERASAYLSPQTYVVGSPAETYSVVVASTVLLRLGVGVAKETLALARKTDGAVASYPFRGDSAEMDVGSPAMGSAPSSPLVASQLSRRPCAGSLRSGTTSAAS